MKQTLKDIYEYEADDYVLFFRTSYLYNNQLKKRIVMMNKKKQNSSKWSYLFVLPIAVIMLWSGNSCSVRTMSKEARTLTNLTSLSGKKDLQHELKHAKIAESLAGSQSMKTKYLHDKSIFKEEHVDASSQKKQDFLGSDRFDVEPKGAIMGRDCPRDFAERHRPHRLSSVLSNGEVIVKKPDTQPSFPEGNKKMMEYISKVIQYPKDPFDKHVEGIVKVSFVVCADGTIADVHVMNKSVRNHDLHREAMRVVWAMPKWIPATIDNKACAVRCVIPVVFKLFA